VELVARHCADGETSPYERLLRDAIRNDASLFTSAESVEAAWRVIDPVLGDVTPLAEYEPGTWGPATAAAVVADEKGWSDPKPEESKPC
jgi:glucose-6-phosphate 1-dehydrogenase